MIDEPLTVRADGGGCVSAGVKLSGGGTWPHPDAVRAAFEAVKPGVMTADWYLIREAVSCLDHIGRHPAGTGPAVAQVRQYRRALRVSR